MLHERRHWPVVVVGAGPAGLAASHELGRRGVDHVVLERGPGPGQSWRGFYTSLILHTGKHLSSLPGMPFGRTAPLFTPRADFLAYLERYALDQHLPVVPDCDVLGARPDASGWDLETTLGPWQARVLVVATGIASRPRVPSLPGTDEFTGGIRHSIEYRDPTPLLGRRVLVVGAGNSGAEIASELGGAGVETWISVRSGVVVVPLTVAGLPSQYIGIALRRLPRAIAKPIAEAAVELGVRRRRDGLPRSRESALDVIPLVGTHLSAAILAGRVRLRPGLAALTPGGARFADGTETAIDEIVLATGFSAAIDWLPTRVGTDDRGFAERVDRVVSAGLPWLLFVGHTYDAGGGLVNIRRDAPLAAEAAVSMLENAR